MKETLFATPLAQPHAVLRISVATLLTFVLELESVLDWNDCDVDHLHNYCSNLCKLGLDLMIYSRKRTIIVP